MVAAHLAGNWYTTAFFTPHRKSMFYLLASCIALLLGPLCYRLIANGNGLQKGLDGFIFVSLGGLVLIHILPELLAHGGVLSLLFVVLGLWGPTAKIGRAHV